MKRPSDVPPVHEISGSVPVCSRMTDIAMSTASSSFAKSLDFKQPVTLDATPPEEGGVR